MKNRKTEKNVYSYGIQLLVLGIIIAVLIIGFLILINGIEIQGNSIIKNNFISIGVYRLPNICNCQSSKR